MPLFPQACSVAVEKLQPWVLAFGWRSAFSAAIREPYFDRAFSPRGRNILSTILVSLIKRRHNHVLQRMRPGHRRRRTLLLPLRQRSRDSAHAQTTDALPSRRKDRGRLCRTSSLFRRRHIASAHPHHLPHARDRSVSRHRPLPNRMDHRPIRAGTETRTSSTTASDKLEIPVTLSS